jgi:DNA-binding response OmpR family regulator
LIVEDDPDILYAITMILEKDFDVVAYNSPVTIVNNRFTVPDLFILDKRMPEMDGLDVCRLLRAKAATAKFRFL